MLNFKKIYKEFEGRIPCEEGCSVCCKKAGDLVLLPEEEKLLIKNVPKAKKYIYSKKINGQTVHLIKEPCPFLKNGLCSIEEYRPFDCRSYPFDYCVFKNDIIAVESSCCPATIKISKSDSEKIKKTLLKIINKVPKKWVKSAVLFGPCGDCNKKRVCKLTQIEGINDKDW